MLRNTIDYVSEPLVYFGTTLVHTYFFLIDFMESLCSHQIFNLKHLFINLYYILALPEYIILRQFYEKSQIKRTCVIDITDFKQ